MASPAVQMSPLWNAFGKHNQGLQSLYEEWRSWSSAIKVYRKILTAIDVCLQKNPDASAQPLDNGTATGANDLPQASYSLVVTDLRMILSFKDEDVGIRKAELFGEAFRDWPLSADPWTSDPAYIVVQALCLVDPTMAFQAHVEDKDSVEISPFQWAARAGATEFVTVMLGELLRHLKASDDPTPQETALRHLAWERKSDRKTAFLFAAENLRLDVLRLLLHHSPSLADMPSLVAAIKKTTADQEEKVQEAALDAFKLILEHMDTAENSDIWGEIWMKAVETPSKRVVTHLLNARGTGWASKFVTYENAKFVIERGSVDMWREFDSEQQRKLMGEGDRDLLHTAVECRQADIVQDILQQFPEQIEVKSGSRQKEYAMEYLGKMSSPDPAYKKIRDALLHAMIRSTSADLGIREIRTILKRSKVEADTICLHLSNIDTEEQSFTEYVQWLREQKDEAGRIFKFESILKYAKFPDLHTQTPKQSQDFASSLREDHSEIKVVLEWLRNRKVTQVLELSVPDRLLSPHSDEYVKYCVDGFQVRVLKWRKLDLYLGRLDKETKENLQELHLYSSGKQAVHDHWYRELKGFRSLRRLFVYVVADVMSEKRLNDSMTELQGELNKINKTCLHGQWTRGRPGLRREGGVSMVPVQEYHWAADQGYKTYRDLDQIRNNVVGPNLAAFIGKYVGYKIPDDQRTKVALIDSGVVIVGGKSNVHASGDKEKTQGTKAPDEQERAQAAQGLQDAGQSLTNDLAERIVDGKSFVSTGDDEEQVWWHASEPHGTQMARLICSVDPCCKLYVVKVAETRSSGIAANVVADAIDWAIDKGVDVISLSLVAYTDTDNMIRAIRRAHVNGIVVLVSTADQGLVTTTTMTDKPSLSDDLLTIAACDRWGNLLAQSQKDGYHFRFFGHDVQVGQIPFLKSEESISGSSVATAIAAGTASLVLACCRISPKCETSTVTVEGKDRSDWRFRMVKASFQRMGEGKDETRQYVALENLCGKNIKLSDVDFKTTVSSVFTSI